MTNMSQQTDGQQGEDKEEGWMKKIKVITRFLCILVASCLLSLTVLTVSAVWAKNTVNAVPVIHSVEQD